MKDKTKRDILMETNRRLQETTQELFMAKQELEQKNKELEEARRREGVQKEKMEQLEQLRALENGIPIRVVIVDYRGRTSGSGLHPPS